MSRAHRIVLGIAAAALYIAVGPAPGNCTEQDGNKSEAQAKKQTRKVALKPNSAGTSFDFETEQMQGTIRAEGAYHGVASLVDRRTGKQLIHPNLSALNLYRLAAVNQVLGIPRAMERTIHADGDSVEVKWAAGGATKDEAVARRQVGEITARYEVFEPDFIEVTVTVRAQRSCSGFEVFMPSYLDKSLQPHIYLQPRGFGRGGAVTEPDLVVPTVSDVFRGTLLVFPRDDHAARRSLDGRWDRVSEIQVCPVRYYAHCLAILANPENRTGVVLMAHPRHAFAISARYHAAAEADRLTPYSAFDFSLFGDDLLPGDERSAKVRLAFTPLDAELSQPLKLYKAFIAEMNAQVDQGLRLQPK
ncbi:MAG: hypothetical protein HY000_33375 [Planctomycetes bacterium]|nr:hypothetical protein [Planctomycetota bacterium]